ncbi:MAG: hypothetical protein PHY47_00960 [Lachnospiraceae bacterium]|nr:hypothetical protein [Lachnospiraceae bacterium]
MSTIKTGLVYQRTVKGPNYICLGKANIGGRTMVISVKNGNIRQDGKCKLRGNAEGAVLLHAHEPTKIARIHQVRDIDVKSVFTNGEALAELAAATKKMVAKGIETSAELPVPARLRV